MTEMEKMLAGEPFDFTAPDVAESLRRRRVNQAHFNAVSFDDGKAYDEALSALIPHRHPTARIMPPFYCDHGHRIQLGEGVFINAGCTFLDCGGITIGDHTLIGPGCRICTPQHPIDFEERRKPVETGLPITIGEDCWLGAGVTVCRASGSAPLDHRRRERRRARHSRGLAGRGKSGGREAELR